MKNCTKDMAVPTIVETEENAATVTEDECQNNIPKPSPLVHQQLRHVEVIPV